MQAAVATGRPVLPVYVLDEASGGAWAPGGAARWWLHHSLAALAASLAARGAALVLRRGRWDEEIPRLAQETGATEVHAGRMHEPWARRAEAAVGKAVTLHLHRTSSLFDPEEIRSKSGCPFGVYTPFMRACRACPAATRTPACTAPHPGAAAPRSDALDDWRLLPTSPDWAAGLRETWKPGEAGAPRGCTPSPAAASRATMNSAISPDWGRHLDALAAPALGRDLACASLARERPCGREHRTRGRGVPERGAVARVRRIHTLARAALAGAAAA